MATVSFKINKKDLDDYLKYQDEISDYPLYSTTSNLTRADIVLLAKILRYQFGNNTTMKVLIEYEKGE